MTQSTENTTEEFDIVVIGAGISGIGAAIHFSNELPNKSLVVLEARESLGGTWDLFRYPGIRSDSDLHTFGYEFKPWRHEHAIADADLILDYLNEAADENHLEDRIRFNHRVRAAHWSSEEAKWTLTLDVTDPETQESSVQLVKASWVFAATGYYRYDQGYSPTFPDQQEFTGQVIHPQHWPQDTSYENKKVVIIGSGATAITMVPAMLKGPSAAEHVTMLQRTPTYVLSLPRVDALSQVLTKLLGQKRGYALTRFKNIWIDRGVVKGLRTFPKLGRKLIRRATVRQLGKHFDVDKHFNPPYDPWDQRLCLAPDGDFFEVINNGSASVVTDSISRFSKKGIILSSGEEIEADIIVTATGLNLQLFDGMPISVDGTLVNISESVAYRGTLLSSIPNWAMAIGYTTSSWTLKVGLLCRYFVDLLKYMDRKGYSTVVPVADPEISVRPVMDLASGYAKRAESLLPKQGETGPWKMAMSYPEDSKALRGDIVDNNLHFSKKKEFAKLGDQERVNHV